MWGSMLVLVSATSAQMLWVEDEHDYKYNTFFALEFCWTKLPFLTGFISIWLWFSKQTVLTCIPIVFNKMWYYALWFKHSSKTNILVYKNVLVGWKINKILKLDSQAVSFALIVVGIAIHSTHRSVVSSALAPFTEGAPLVGIDR